MPVVQPRISPLAAVDSRAELADDVEVGPFCVIGPHAKIDSGCKLDSHVVITGHTTVGRNNRFHSHTVIGGEPQDYSYSGAPTFLEIGNDNIFREGVTVNRGAEKEDWITRIDNHCLLMSNSHVAHNCHLHDNVILVNGVLLGGHVHIHDGAIISGNAAVHHFATVGTLAFVGGMSRVTVDVAPYMLHNGNDQQKIVTINLVGLQRRGISRETIQLLKRAHRLLFRELGRLDDVRQALTEELAGNIPAELLNLFDFMEQQHQGKNGRAGEVRRNKPSVPAKKVKPESDPPEDENVDHAVVSVLLREGEDRIRRAA